MKLLVKKGATSFLACVFIQDSSSTVGAGLSGLVFNTSGLVCYRARADDGNAGGTSIALATATLGTWATGGFKEKDATNMKGVYEIGITNASLAAGSDYCVLYFSGATNMAPLVLEIQLVAFDPDDAVHLGLSSLPNTAVTTNASLLTSGTGTDQISNTSGRVDVGKALGTAVTLDANNVLNVSAKYVGGTLLTARDIGASVLLSAGTGTGQLDFTSGVVKSSLVQILGTALTETAGQIAAAFKQFFNIASPTSTMNEITLVDTVTTYTGNTKQTGDAFARLGAPAGASVSADIAAVKSDSGAIKTQTDKLAFTVPNQVDANVLDWKSATAPAMTGDAFARLGAPAGASVSADIAAIKSDTGTILTDVNTGAGAIYNRIGAPAGASIAADIAAVKTDLDAGVTVTTNNDKTGYAITSNVKKNTAQSAFMLVMTDATTHAPKTGLTVTATRSIDGAAFGACANAVSEVSGGWYTIALAASDVNGNDIALRFTSAGADDCDIKFKTQP